jgi:hypothetical protein
MGTRQIITKQSNADKKLKKSKNKKSLKTKRNVQIFEIIIKSKQKNQK